LVTSRKNEKSALIRRPGWHVAGIGKDDSNHRQVQSKKQIPGLKKPTGPESTSAATCSFWSI
jgi:hypothetical protein